MKKHTRKFKRRTKAKIDLNILSNRTKVIILLWIIVVALTFFIVPALSQNGVREKRFNASKLPLIIEDNYTNAPINATYLTEKLEIMFEASSLIGYKTFFTAYFFIETDSTVEEELDLGSNSSVVLYIKFSFLCNGQKFYEEWMFADLGIIGYGTIPSGYTPEISESKGIEMIEDDIVKLIDSSLLKRGRNILTLEISLAIKVFVKNIPKHSYYKLNINKFWCKVRPLDTDKDGILDPVDLLIGVNNTIASLSISVAGIPTCIVIEQRISKAVKRLLKPKNK